MTGFMALSLNFSAPLNAAWNPSVQVSDGVTAFDSVLSVNSSNNGVAVWGEERAIPPFREYGIVYSASYNYGSGWTAPVVISPPDLGSPPARFLDQGDPDVRINESGYAIAVWEATYLDAQDNDFDMIISATRSSSGIWSPVQIVREGPDVNFKPENPVVAVNDAGLGVTVWNEVRGANDTAFIMTSFLPFNGTWTPAFQLDTGPSILLQNTPDVEINNNGNAVATWLLGDNNFSYEVKAATYDPITAIWTTVTLDVNPLEDSNPFTGIDNNGNAVVIWQRRNGNLTEIVASSFTIGTGWAPYVVIDSADSSIDEFASLPYVVMDQFGTATAVWNKGVLDVLEEVFASRLPLGETWSTPVSIAIGEIDPFEVQKTADVDEFGNVVVITTNITTNDQILQSVLYKVEGGWQTPENIFSNNRITSFENIGIGSCGFALSLWTRVLSFFPQERVVVVEASDNLQLQNFVLPPSNFVGLRCCNKFATQKNCINRLSWSSVECAASYVLRRNGMIIATIPAGGSTSYDDPVCSKNPSVYTLSVISVGGVESQPTTITML